VDAGKSGNRTLRFAYSVCTSQEQKRQVT
jgi:hypothetical protein